MDKILEDITKWLTRDKYRRLGNDVSVTELLKPVRAVHLQNRHRDKLKVRELDNSIAALTGNGLHDQLQRYLRDEDRVSGNWMIERRLLAVIDGVRVSGRFDALYKDEVVYDIKTTRAWKFMKGDYTDWETQLNMYDYMLSLDGISVNSLRIMGIVLDWQAGEAWKPEYPKSRIEIIEMAKWSRSEQEKFMRTKISAWKKGLTKSDLDLPLCKPTERWADKPVWKLYRLKSSKRATKTFYEKSKAERYMAVCTKNNPTKWKEGRIEKTHAQQWKRCDNWCDVAPFCEQYIHKIES
jgi:hypothetical protein